MSFIINETPENINIGRYLEKPESRVVKLKEAASAPFNAVGKVISSKISDSSNMSFLEKGTAFKVARNVFMTAAHVVIDINGRFTNTCIGLQILIGYPYTGISLKSQRVFIPKKYIEAKLNGGNSTQHDYAFIITEETYPIEPLKLNFCSSETGNCISVGYPDKYNYGGNTMRLAKGNYSRPYLESMYLMQNNDMSSGCSGGPILDSKTLEVISLNSSEYEVSKDLMAGPIFNGDVEELLFAAVDSV